VWFHNQDHVYIDHDVTISQETFITTGSHAHRRDMALITKPIRVEAGAWVTSRCIVLGGSRIGRSALVTPGTVVTGEVPENTIWGSQNAPAALGHRFELTSQP
jgi:putative colanic acid biosynthesis acetyltransferase WcaF